MDCSKSARAIVHASQTQGKPVSSTQTDSTLAKRELEVLESV
jgi:hypothetical protein